MKVKIMNGSIVAPAWAGNGYENVWERTYNKYEKLGIQVMPYHRLRYHSMKAMELIGVGTKIPMFNYWISIKYKTLRLWHSNSNWNIS